jgi:pimeloyl-ACP methyl ester carboxylesterase
LIARRATVALLLATALVAGCVTADHSVRVVGFGPTTTSEPGPSGSTTPEPLGDHQLSEWEDCDDGLQCATLEVPLDWSRRRGETITLAVVRKPATSSTGRIGSVLMNPGGPGEPGTDFLRDFIGAKRIPKGLDERFDLVSWDPRGTGGSAGVRCLTDEQSAAPDPDPSIDSRQDLVAIRAEASELIDGCKARAARIWTDAGTRETVRDLDALRGALGDEKLTYVGYSYGTTIGIEYGRMFPAHIRAMVLDGVSLPAIDPVEAVHGQARSFEHNFESFLDDCDRRAICLFGGGDAHKAFADLVADLETGKRLPADYTLPDENGQMHRRRGTVGVGELYNAVAVSLYSKANWIALEKALAAAARGDGQLLLYLRDTFAGRRMDGTWSHLPDANQAINCADQRKRAADADGDDTLRAEWGAELPLLGALFAVGTPGCYGFPAAEEPLTQVRAKDLSGVPPVVVVGSTEDPATPYARSEELAGVLPEASLVTWRSPDHTAYGRGSDCLDEPVTTYLEDLRLPERGLTCTP